MHNSALHHLPSLDDTLETLLLCGGDTRLTLSAETGLTPSGCSPAPLPTTLSYGSATASTISVRAYHHLKTELRRLRESARFVSSNDLLDRETERHREELQSLLSLPQDTDLLFSPSGTDSTLHALFLTQARFGNAPLDCLLIASDETGSSIPFALSGKHFNAMAAGGVSVSPGERIMGLGEDVTLVPFPIRDAKGFAYSEKTLERRIYDAVARSVALGRRVLLQTMAGSKFGTDFPDAGFLNTLENHFPDKIQVVVDACQLRLDPAELKQHLAQGHLVLISGSKFFTGPPFSGALLVPDFLSETFAKIPSVPTGLLDYADRVSFPISWTSVRGQLPDRPNFGAWFRWEAALEEMRAYFAVPIEFRQAALTQFEMLATELLKSHHSELYLLERSFEKPTKTHENSGETRTIFPFLVCGIEGNWLSPTVLTDLYRDLNRNLTDDLPVALFSEERCLISQRCHVGQPVTLTYDGTQTAAIRLCASARTVTDLWARTPDAASLDLDQERQEIETILDKTALIARLLTSSRPALKRAA